MQLYILSAFASKLQEFGKHVEMLRLFSNALSDIVKGMKQENVYTAGDSYIYDE